MMRQWVYVVGVVTMVLVCAVASQSFAATYYIAPGGLNTNSGNIGSPWATLQHASDVMVAGDTVNVRGGTYSDRLVVSTSGSDGGGYITYQNYPGETPIYSGGTGVWIGAYDKNYLKFIGLTFQNYTGGAFNVLGQCSHIEIRNNTIL